MNADVRIEDLPPLARQLVELLGREKAFALLEWRGGRRVYVPDEPRAGHQVVAVIGIVAARRLSDRFGRWLELPSCAAIARSERNIAVRARYAAGGVSRDALARELGLSLRQVGRILETDGD